MTKIPSVHPQRRGPWRLKPLRMNDDIKEIRHHGARQAQKRPTKHGGASFVYHFRAWRKSPIKPENTATRRARSTRSHIRPMPPGSSSLPQANKKSHLELRRTTLTGLADGLGWCSPPRIRRLAPTLGPPFPFACPGGLPRREGLRRPPECDFNRMIILSPLLSTTCSQRVRGNGSEIHGKPPRWHRLWRMGHGLGNSRGGGRIPGRRLLVFVDFVGSPHGGLSYAQPTEGDGHGPAM